MGAAFCVSKVGRREERLAGGHCEPGTSPIAFLVTLRTQGNMKTSCEGIAAQRGGGVQQGHRETRGDPRPLEPHSIALLQ